MASRANIIEMEKLALLGKGGAVPMVPIYGTYSTASTAATAILDLNGNAIVLDFDGFVSAAFFWGNTSAGAATMVINIAGTAVLTPNTTTADQMEADFNTADYSERDFVAGSALTITASAADAQTGSVLLLCIPT